LHQPWRRAPGTKNPRWGEEEEDDAAEKGTNEEIRVFTLAKCALFKHVLMGLWSGKAQSIFLGFFSANSKEELPYQRKYTLKKKRGEESRK
jgi:hypothetical protein